MYSRVLALAVVSVLGIAACGGHGTPQPTPVPQPPPVEQPPPPPPPPPPTLAVTRILAFGDSMTAGTTSPALAFAALTAGLPESYPSKLQGLETDRYSAQSVTVLNAGQPGEFVQDSRTRKRLSGMIGDASPEVVLLMEGANDLNNGTDTPNTTINATVNALEDMVRDTTGRGITVMLATLPPQRPPKGNAASFLTRYNDALRTMASKKGAILVDVYAQFPIELIGQDGLHPTEAGYQKLAEIFQSAIAAKWEHAPEAR